MYQGLDQEYSAVAVVGVGPEDAGFNSLESLDECRENVRVAAAVGVRRLNKLEMRTIVVDGMGSPEAAAEGAVLANWKFQENRACEDRYPVADVMMMQGEDANSWDRGVLKAESQNLARYLSDLPSNQLTPPAFAQKVMDAVCPCGVYVMVRQTDWLQMKKMGAFLHVARGSTEPPLFIELNYCGGCPDDRPVVLVGKGVTFDTGGLCLKKCPAMRDFKADMAGAAVVVATMRAAAAMRLPINIVGLIPLCEHMLSGMAMKPGDVVMATNGLTVRVENTCNEGRMIMADALAYGVEFYKPHLTVDVATLTSGMKAALGASSSGVYTNSHDMWDEINKAGAITGDRVWRFPLWDHFRRRVVMLKAADVTNVGFGPGGGPCRGAAFLYEFVECGDWVHIDIGSSGLKTETPDFPYLEVGRMTGRPTRTLIQFLIQIACPQDSDCEEVDPCLNSNVVNN